MVFFVLFISHMLLFFLIYILFLTTFLLCYLLTSNFYESLTVFSLFCFPSWLYNWTVFSRLFFSDMWPLDLGSAYWIRKNQFPFPEQRRNALEPQAIFFPSVGWKERNSRTSKANEATMWQDCGGLDGHVEWHPHEGPPSLWF